MEFIPFGKLIFNHIYGCSSSTGALLNSRVEVVIKITVCLDFFVPSSLRACTKLSCTISKRFLTSSVKPSTARHVQGYQVMAKSLCKSWLRTFAIVDVLHWHVAEYFAFLHGHEERYLFSKFFGTSYLFKLQRVRLLPLQLLQVCLSSFPLLSLLLFLTIFSQGIHLFLYF